MTNITDIKSLCITMYLSFNNLYMINITGIKLLNICLLKNYRYVNYVIKSLNLSKKGEELHIELDEICTEDVYAALKHTKPSAQTMKDRYIQWQKNYESV